jgi:hypothetical protein
MLRRGQGERVPPPTQEQFKEAVALDRAIDACSGVSFGPLIAMNIAFRNGDISTVCLDQIGALHLVDALKILFPGIESPPASSARRLPGGAVQAGHMSA